MAVGQAMAPDHMLGRLFSPMVEFLAVRDFKPGPPPIGISAGDADHHKQADNTCG